MFLVQDPKYYIHEFMTKKKLITFRVNMTVV